MAYILLAFSIILEVFGSTMLKLSDGFSKILPVLGVITGFGIAFYLISLALIELSLGFTYAVWSGVGTILTAIIGVFLFKEELNKMGVIGIALLLVGIILLNVA